MLKYNLNRMLSQRGISSTPVGFFIRNGFKKTSASRWARGDFKEISMGNLEKLCLLFRCTPNDLMEWTPPKNTIADETQPLTKLLTGSVLEFNLQNLSGDIPYDKLSTFAQKIIEVKKELLNKK